MPNNLPSTLVNQKLSQQYDFILASASPRRRELLAHLGLPFRVGPPENGARVDETPHPGETPAELVQRLSQAKAQAVAASLPRFQRRDEVAPIPVIIAADTVVVLAGQILGKPATLGEAVAMLQALRAHPYHDVCSGVTVGAPANTPYQPSGGESEPPASTNAAWKLITRLHRSQVWMRAYSDAEIETYVASGDPLDKAGAYAIQHQRFAPVARLDGCFASVMGMPLCHLARSLRRLK
jgi:septum formation protein